MHNLWIYDYQIENFNIFELLNIINARESNYN